MRIFLTGGTGFIGQPLSLALRKRGWSITALVRTPDSPYAQALSERGIQLVKGDVTQPETMRSAMREADLVVHNAGLYEYGLDRAGNQRMHLVNVEGTKNVLALAQELNVTRTVYVSTLQAYGQTGLEPCDETYTRQYPIRSAYEQSKTEAHEIARQYQQGGLPLIIVCPHQVIGPNDHSPFGYFMRLYINHLMPPAAWCPDTIMCLVEVHDLAEGIALAAEKGSAGEIYFMCGDPQSIRGLFEDWKKHPGSSHPAIWLPAGMVSALAAVLEPLERRSGLDCFLSREFVHAGEMHWNYSSKKAQQELGWTYRSPEAMWSSTYEGEIQLLSKRKTRSLLERLKPVDFYL